MKNIFKSALLTAAVALSAHAAQAETLTVGANIGNVPWEFQDKTGKNVGFEIDLINEVAKRLKMDVEITNIPFNGLFAAVQSGQIDAAVSSITITKKRLKSVAFAQPYYDSDQSLTARSDSSVKSVADVKGKIIAVDTGSTGDIWSMANKDKVGIAEIRRYEGLSNAMLDLVAGRTDGYISDIPAMQYYTKDKPELKVVARIKTGEQYSIMFAKDSPLQGKVNAILTELKGEGFIAALHGKWFGSVPEKTTSTVMVMDAPKES